MTDAEQTTAEDRLDALARLQVATEAGLVSCSEPLSAWVSQAIDEVDHRNLEAALAAYPLLWWAHVYAHQSNLAVGVGSRSCAS